MIMNKRHGMAKTRLNNIYHSMKNRCNNPNNYKYKNYGARGIKVCDEWSQDFANFYNWAISSGYREGLSIDRIDNNGNYEPSNCRWVTQYEQNRNQRSNHMVTYNGETLCLTDMGIKYGINPKILSNRLRYGWSIERALTEPVHKIK